MWVPVNCECVCRRSKDCIKICCRDEGLRRFFSFFLFLSFHPSFLEYKATVVFSSLKDVNKHSVTIYALPNTLIESSCCNHSCQEVMGGGGKAASQPSEQIWRKAGRLRVTLELVLELVSVSLSCRGLFDFFLSHSTMKKTYNKAWVMKTSLQIPFLLLNFRFVCFCVWNWK